MTRIYFILANVLRVRASGMQHANLCSECKLEHAQINGENSSHLAFSRIPFPSPGIPCFLAMHREVICNRGRNTGWENLPSAPSVLGGMKSNAERQTAIPPTPPREARGLLSSSHGRLKLPVWSQGGPPRYADHFTCMIFICSVLTLLDLMRFFGHCQ